MNASLLPFSFSAKLFFFPDGCFPSFYPFSPPLPRLKAILCLVLSSSEFALDGLLPICSLLEEAVVK